LKSLKSVGIDYNQFWPTAQFWDPFRQRFTRNSAGQQLVLFLEPFVEGGLRVVDLAEENQTPANLLAPSTCRMGSERNSGYGLADW
jgi:hypothetical protein